MHTMQYKYPWGGANFLENTNQFLPPPRPPSSFFFNDTANTVIYTRSRVGSVRFGDETEYEPDQSQDML